MKIHSARPSRLLFTLFVPLFLFLALPAPGPAAQETKPARVAILPFQAHAAKDMSYLTSGIRDMLASRLAAGGGVRVIDQAAVDQALAAGKPSRPEALAALGKELGAEYVISGSLTAFGAGMSLDAKVLPTAPGGTTRNFFATAATENGIIQAIDQLAGDIGAKVFSQQRPGHVQAQAAPAAPAAGQPAYQTAHPDRAFQYRGGYGTGSPFIRPKGITSPLGFTKSQNFNFGLRDMDVGDVDGDGKDEVVLASMNEVRVYRRDLNRFTLMGKVQTRSRYPIHSVSVADVNGNGRAEIYVSAADPKEPNSLALEWDGKKFAFLFQDVPWYIRALEMPGEGPILAGQKAGIDTFLVAGIYRLNQTASGLQQGNKLPVNGVNLFDFSLADLDGDGTVETVAISQGDKLMVLRPSGKVLWISDDFYGGTTRYLGGTDYEDVSAYGEQSTTVQRVYVPGRIIIRDINKDGQPDVIVNKNLSTASRLLARLKTYPSGEVHALTWNGIALTELWRTRKIDGYIADYQLGPEQALPAAGKDKEPAQGAELFVGLVLRSGGLNIFSSSDSTVLIYPLEFSAAEEGK